MQKGAASPMTQSSNSALMEIAINMHSWVHEQCQQTSAVREPDWRRTQRQLYNGVHCNVDLVF